MEKVKNRRRNYYIKKKFQRNFILKFCALVVLGSVISGAILYALSSATVTTTFENSRLTIKSTADYILPMVFLASVFVVIIVGIATIFITLFTSHRIAGPLYRMEKDVGEVASGKLNTRFNLRTGDEIKPLALSLDKMAQVMKDRVAAMKEIVGDLESAANLSAQTSPDIKKQIKRLKDEITKFTT